MSIKTVKTTVKDKEFEQLTSNELPAGFHALYNCHEDNTLQNKTLHIPVPYINRLNSETKMYTQ